MRALEKRDKARSSGRSAWNLNRYNQGGTMGDGSAVFLCLLGT